MAYQQDDDSLNAERYVRVTGHFDPLPEISAPLNSKTTCRFAEQYSWSTIKVRLFAVCSFPIAYVRDREMEWIIIRPLEVHSLPDIPTREEVHRLDQSVPQFALTLFCWIYTGLRIMKGLPWKCPT